jgi:uncharacterized lipoprotein YbaY/heat shock protein HslJ
MGEKSGIIKGKAFYRERIALPPGAVFEAVLEDVSRQDIEAREIGRTVDEDAKGPPYVFSIAYDTADIDPRLSYAVRTMIRVDGKLKFTTDMMHPVLTRGAGSEVEIMMKMVHGQPPIMPKEATEIMGGEISYEGDEAFFTDALTGRRHELASDGDRERLDSAYHDGSRDEVRALYVTFEGRVDEEGRVRVTRFINAWPSQSNERSRADSSLTNTYWRIARIRGEKVEVMNAKREPHIILKCVDGQNQYSATVGCNQLAGDYLLEGDRLTFTMGATTLMACIPPLEALERALCKMIAETRWYQVKGQTLELYDQEGNGIALLEAVYL